MLRTLGSIFFWGAVIVKSSLVIAYKVAKMYSICRISTACDYLCYWFHTFVWSKTPWWLAYVTAAWIKYTETTLYHDRLITAGERYAFSAYFGEGCSEGDASHFKCKVRKDRVLMAKIIFTPYSVGI